MQTLFAACKNPQLCTQDVHVFYWLEIEKSIFEMYAGRKFAL